MMNWQSMESAPKDRRIVVWCDHNADKYFDDASQTLSPYGTYCEGGNGHASDGLHVVEWQDQYEEGSYEEGYYHMPGWWFVVDTDCELVANPVAWIDVVELTNLEKLK